MDTAYPNGTATLVALVDGTTSLYTTSGFGIIGGGSHPTVGRASRAFLSALEAHLDRFGEDPGTDLPASGRVVMHALTYTGRRAMESREDELGRGRLSLSPVFFAAQQVIAALHSIDQQRSH
jgi:hypothetical protein